jgi:hypothetical protein
MYDPLLPVHCNPWTQKWQHARFILIESDCTSKKGQGLPANPAIIALAGEGKNTKQTWQQNMGKAE